MDKGWIKLHRSLLDWEWYEDKNVSRLFIHLLLTANFEDKNWRGVVIKRGQIVTSNENLSKSTGLTIQQIRTAIKKLKSTGELTSKSTNAFTLLTIENYSIFQEKEDSITSGITSEATNEQQTDNKRVTTTKEVKNIRKGRVLFLPPTEQQIHELFLSVGMVEDQGAEARRFLDYYGQQNWKLSNGNKMADWKAAGRNWLRNQRKWENKQ